MLTYLWLWFLDLNAARGAGMAGPLPISYTELQAYFTMHGITPLQWELEAIRRLDIVAMTVMSADTAPPPPKPRTKKP